MARKIVNKFGHAEDGLQVTLTDIWDRADATPTQQLWTAPTAARVHNITSTSTNDDGSPAGTGARTVRVWGLETWDSPETFEDITMNGTSNVATSNSYVIIHRMQVLTSGSAGPNAGTITATAVTDATVTAQINVAGLGHGYGQTQMAIYGIPSVQKLLVFNWYANINASGNAKQGDFDFFVNPEPNSNASTWVSKQHRGAQSDGTSNLVHRWEPYFEIEGPAIVKISGASATGQNDVDVSAGFDGELVGI